MDTVSSGCQQYSQSDLVGVCGGADTDPTRDGAMTEERVHLSVAQIKKLRYTVPNITYFILRQLR